MSIAPTARRAGLVAALVSAATAIALVGSAGADDAAKGPKTCPSKTLCVWGDDGFAGQLVKIKSDGISNKLAEKMNNGASSVFNNRNKRAVLYDKKNGNGDDFCIDPEATLDSLSGFNDLASSSKNTNNNSDCPA